MAEVCCVLIDLNQARRTFILTFIHTFTFILSGSGTYVPLKPPPWLAQCCSKRL